MRATGLEGTTGRVSAFSLRLKLEGRELGTSGCRHVVWRDWGYLGKSRWVVVLMRRGGDRSSGYPRARIKITNYECVVEYVKIQILMNDSICYNNIKVVQPYS